MLVDSGNRREFATGAVRDIAEGKGRCDLLPLNVIAKYINTFYDMESTIALHSIFYDLNTYIRYGYKDYICSAINVFINYAFKGNVETALLELAVHYEDGANKYSPRNWEKGINLHCYIDSAIRHLLKYYRGDDDERHDRAFLWNLFGCLWTMEEIEDGRLPEELNDLPFAEK